MWWLAAVSPPSLHVGCTRPYVNSNCAPVLEISANSPFPNCRPGPNGEKSSPSHVSYATKSAACSSLGEDAVFHAGTVSMMRSSPRTNLVTFFVTLWWFRCGTVFASVLGWGGGGVSRPRAAHAPLPHATPPTHGW